MKYDQVDILTQENMYPTEKYLTSRKWLGNQRNATSLCRKIENEAALSMYLKDADNWPLMFSGINYTGHGEMVIISGSLLLSIKSIMYEYVEFE